MNINDVAKEIGEMIAKEAVNMIDPEATVAALWALLDKYDEDLKHQVCGDAATLIELLQGQLAESQRRERAAAKCDGCTENGKWENEVEYGYSSPCTRCKRRCADNWRGPHADKGAEK